MEWAYKFQAAIQPFAERGIYTNFLGDEGEEQVRASYNINYERLVALKNTYDPTNFFQLNQNIKPTLKRSKEGELQGVWKSISLFQTPCGLKNWLQRLI